MVVDSYPNKAEMIKDLLICVLSSLNILLFSFIGLNYEAFKKINHYQAAAKAYPEFDHLVWDIIHRLAQPAPEPTTLHGSAETAESLFLSIPKLNILSPIHLPQESQAIHENLEKGIISLKPFLQPGSPGQNVLFGHSSDYPWNNNPFGTIFTLLPKLENGDEILITRGDELIRYQVRSTRITDPQLTGLLNKTRQHELILSTCYPIGFFSKRYNVIATPTENRLPISNS